MKIKGLLINGHIQIDQTKVAPDNNYQGDS